MAMVSETTYAGDAKRNPRSQEILKRLHILQEQANALQDSTGEVASKIVGPQPPEAISANTLKEVAPLGFFAEMDTLISSIDSMLRRTHDNIDRFRREF